MKLKHLKLLKKVIEQVKEDEKAPVGNETKVYLDYLANYFGNIIIEIEKKPRIKETTFRLRIEV